MIDPGLDSSASVSSFRTMNRISGHTLILTAGLLLPSCGLVKMPFRVAGAVVDGVYVTGKSAADATSDALERRKAKKEKEKAEEEKKATAEKAKQEQEQEPSVLPPPDAVTPVQGPVIPVDDQPLPPIIPEPLPQ